MSSDRPTDATLLILVSLAAGRKHGYAIMTDIQTFAGVRLGPGTLYAALDRLEQAGHVQGERRDARRIEYRITPTGRGLVRDRLAELHAIIGTGLKRIAAH